MKIKKYFKLHILLTIYLFPFLFNIKMVTNYNSNLTFLYASKYNNKN